GEQVQRFPCHGNETVLDAVAQVAGLPKVASRCRMWVARPAGPDNPCQVLPVDWKAITQRGAAATNYSLMAGDRIYVEEAGPRPAHLLRQAFGDSSEALKAAIQVEVHSAGLVLAADHFIIEPDGQALFAPCWLARFSDAGEGPQPVVAVRCAQAWVTFDG